MLKQIALHIIPKIAVMMSVTFLLSGCVSEDFHDSNDTESASAEGEAEAEVTFTISCGYNQEISEDFSNAIPSDIYPMVIEGDTTTISDNVYNQPTDTRADGTPANPNYTNELIHDWILYFVRSSKILKILKRSDTETCIKDATSSVEAETFKCVFPGFGSGISVYAFANVTEDELIECGWNYKVGDSFNTSTASYFNKTWNDNMLREDSTTQKNLRGWSHAYPIPMSGFKSGISVAKNSYNHFSIEMIRMVAKIQLNFTNSTDKDIFLSTYYLGPQTSNKVPLFPLTKNSKGATVITYDHLGNYSYTPVVTETQTSLAGFIPNENIKAGSSYSCYFYTKECRSTRENDKSFTVSIKVTHDGATEIQQYRQLRDIKEYINRNDWIVIPINISRYDVKVKALFYPAIGTYPAVQSDFDQYGYQIFKFTSSGEFAIVTEVTDKETDRLLSPAEYNVTFDTSSFSDPNGVIQGGVAGLQVENGSIGFPTEIIGTLTGTKGTASMKLNIELPKADGSSQTYIRDIYIVGA